MLKSLKSELPKAVIRNK